MLYKLQFLITETTTTTETTTPTETTTTTEATTTTTESTTPTGKKVDTHTASIFLYNVFVNI